MMNPLQNISLSREVSFAQDDSSFGDISRLSAVELPTMTSGGMSSELITVDGVG